MLTLFPFLAEEFLLGAQRVSRLTPLEVELLFQLSDLCGDKGRISMKTLDMITPLEEGSMPYNIATQQKVLFACNLIRILPVQSGRWPAGSTIESRIVRNETSRGVTWASEGGAKIALDLKIDIFRLNIQQKRLFSKFGMGKMKCHHLWPPLEKSFWIFWLTSRKIHYWPTLGENPSDVHGGGMRYLGHLICTFLSIVCFCIRLHAQPARLVCSVNAWKVKVIAAKLARTVWWASWLLRTLMFWKLN